MKTKYISCYTRYILQFKKKKLILKNLYFFNYKMLDSYSFVNIDMITLADI